jgi:hypothetical protein
VVLKPYVNPDERKVGTKRPKIAHVDSKTDKRTRQDRQAEKRAVIDERRAIKKSARRHLQKELEEELDNV